MKQLLYIIITAILLLPACSEVDQNTNYQVEDDTLFTVLQSDVTGLHFKNTIPESAQMNSMTYEYYYNGGGVSVGDVNQDGLPDLFFTGNVTHNKLYLNRGNFQFEDITDQSGIKDSPSWTTGSTMVDINNDGIMDIYVCRSGKLSEEQRANLFFISKGLNSEGLPVYENQAPEVGLADTGYGTQALFFDYDRDNDLDMYLLNHNVYVQAYYDLEKIRNTKDPNVGDKLFRNDDGAFVEVTVQAGIISNELGYGLGVSAGDLNNDGWVDIYVANDYSEHDFLYLNQQDGTFKEIAKSSFGHQSNYSMGTDMADINNDGLIDIAVLDMLSEDNYGIKTSMGGMDPDLFDSHVKNGFHYQYMHNTMQLNRGNEQFSEISRFSGISSTDWSWAPLLLDLDLDGLQDLFVTNGLKRDFRNNDFKNLKIKRLQEAEENPEIDRKRLIETLVANTPQRLRKNHIYKNMDGLRFEKKITDWGGAVPSFSNGLSYGDLDNDGDLDLIVNNIDEPPFIYKNKAVDLDLGSFLKIRLAGHPRNPNGIGSRVTLFQSGNIQVRELFFTKGYQSSVEPVLHFGTPHSTRIDSLKVLWPDGKSQVLGTIDLNQTLIIEYGEATPTSHSGHLVDALFQATEVGFDYTHQENDFDDFEREVLLPHRMSRLGPGVAVGDINGDDLEDVFIGGAKGQAGGIFLQQSNDRFIKSRQPALSSDRGFEDMDGLFFDADGDLDNDLYVVSGGNEFDPGDPMLQDRLYLNENGQMVRSDRLPKMSESGFRIGANDFDRDGDLDLFVGGRQVPGKYPYPAKSRLLVNEGGTFTNTANLTFDLGMVTDMVWTDYDQDGDTDMIVVGEWMPITFLQNSEGQFSIDTEIKGTESSGGWWYSIKAADFDQDGDLDYVVGNNGLNYKYGATDEEPFEIYAGDLDENGRSDIVLGYYDGGNLFPLRGKECSSQQIPDLNNKYATYHDFARATLKEVYGGYDLQHALKYQVSTFSTTYLENLGGKHFKMKPLPAIAQLSSVNQILIEDLNNDNFLDLILAGNNYQAEVETTRNDAGKGTVLLGNSKGDFVPMSTLKSGMYLSGDLRDMAWIQLGSGNRGVLSVYNNAPLKFHVLDQNEENGNKN